MLICFDVDGTLLTDEMNNEGEYVKGIIPTTVLIDLWKQGHKIAIVSPSPFLPRQFSGDNHWFKRNSSNDYRWENIRDAMKYYHYSDLDGLIYVDDLIGNHRLVKKEIPTIGCYTPKEFMKIYSTITNTIESDSK